MKDFLRNGYTVVRVPLPESIKASLEAEDWNKLDFELSRLVKVSGILFEILSRFENFSEIEHMLAIREPPDDEGIWHDDGSRVLAFSLSLNLRPQAIEGGALHFRKRGSEEFKKITPLPYGEMLVFQTGHNGYEHRVEAIGSGRRIICAGWCT